MNHHGESRLTPLSRGAQIVGMSSTYQVFNALPSGGSFSIMDIDPNSDFFRKFRASLAFAGFASTEPWIKEYCSMDLPSRLSAAGFVDISVASNSPRHRTVVAFKP